MAAALALMLHLAMGLSLWLSREQGHIDPGPAHGVATPSQAWTVLSRTGGSAAPVEPSRPGEQLASAPSGLDGAPTAAPTPAQEAPALPSGAAASAPSGASPTLASEPPYYRRPDLDLGPAPLNPVLIGFPAGVATGTRHTGRLSLFIDETGTVRKVEILPTEPPLPPPMQDAARVAFMQAQFSPGQRLGAIVRSRIDIEVTFDDRPPDSLEAEARSPSSRRQASPGA